MIPYLSVYRYSIDQFEGCTSYISLFVSQTKLQRIQHAFKPAILGWYLEQYVYDTLNYYVMLAL